MKLIRLFIVFLSLSACESDSTFQLSLRPSSAELVPQAESYLYRNQDGDTLRLRAASRETGFINSSEQLSAAGTLPEVENIQTEIRRLRLRAEIPPLEFSYTLDALRDSDEPSGSRDLLEVSISDPSGKEHLILENKDSLSCISAPCRFQKSLKLLERNFQNVYFTPRDSVNVRMLFLNASDGLIGFRTINNDLYELLP